MGGLRFGVDGDGNGGYYKADDSFVPFSGVPNKGMFFSNYSYLFNGGGQGDVIPFNDGDNNLYDTSIFELSSDYKTITVKKSGSYDFRAFFNGIRYGTASVTTGIFVNNVLKFGRETLNSGETGTNESVRICTLNLNQGDKITFKFYAVAYGGNTCGIDKYSNLVIKKA